MRLTDRVSRYKTPLNFLNSVLFNHGISLVTSFFTYRYIAPEYLGIWGTFTVFSTIATFLRLGIPNGMNRQLPFYLGKGDVKKAESYASTTLSYSYFTMLVMSAIAVVFLLTNSFSSKGDLALAYKWAAIVFFVQIIIDPFSTYLSGTFRTSSNFDKLSRIQYLNGAYKLISVFFVALWGYVGFLIRELVAFLLNALLLFIYRPLPHIKARFDWAVFKDLFNIGFSIFIVSYISTFIDTIPRLFIVKNGTSLDMGLFSPSLIILGLVALIPNTISNYLYPKFSYACGEGVSRLYYWNMTKKMLLASLAMGLVAALLVFFFIDYVIIVFPKYKAALPYIKLTCFAMAFIGHKLTDVSCVVLKEWKWLWVRLIIYGLSIVSSLILLQQIMEDIISISVISIAVTNIIQYISSFVIVYLITHKSVSGVEKA